MYDKYVPSLFKTTDTIMSHAFLFKLMHTIFYDNKWSHNRVVVGFTNTR